MHYGGMALSHFSPRMIDPLSCFCNDSHPVRLLAWWVEFFGHWNGISFFLFPTLEPLPDFSVCSDASGAIDYGAFKDSECFNGRWFPHQIRLSIAYKELFPVVLAAHTVNSEDLFQPQNSKLAPEAPGADQPTVGLFQPQLGQN